jgi:acetyl-CoA C-acetyltransferase
MLSNAFIPYGGYYSSPFVRWQGSLANENAINLGGDTSKRWLAQKGWNPMEIDYVILGLTIHQHHSFYGGPFSAALIGAERTPGVLLSQACTTSATGIFQASTGIEAGLYSNVYCLMTDRCSNGPHTIWPNPNGPGGQVISENWLMDNFGRDPWAKNAMIDTAENVAKEAGITKEQCDDLSLRRYEQYLDSLANDRAFQKRYMYPLEVQLSKKKTIVVAEDEGVMPTTADGLAKLKPVNPGGVHTFGTQTHPADGHCGMMVATREKAKALSTNPSIEIQVLSYGYSRAAKGYMAAAVVPAAKMALEKANLSIDQVKEIKTHNPFAVNDLYFAQQFKIDWKKMNNFGCSLVYGHPQAPTAGRSIIEGIEAVVQGGGGYLLWAGCAAGDTGGALVLKIG